MIIALFVSILFVVLEVSFVGVRGHIKSRFSRIPCPTRKDADSGYMYIAF